MTTAPRPTNAPSPRTAEAGASAEPRVRTRNQRRTHEWQGQGNDGRKDPDVSHVSRALTLTGHRRPNGGGNPQAQVAGAWVGRRVRDPDHPTAAGGHHSWAHSRRLSPIVPGSASWRRMAQTALGFGTDRIHRRRPPGISCSRSGRQGSGFPWGHCRLDWISSVSSIPGATGPAGQQIPRIAHDRGAPESVRGRCDHHGGRGWLCGSSRTRLPTRTVSFRTPLRGRGCAAASPHPHELY